MDRSDLATRMKAYFVEAECEYRAKKKLALQLGVPISCIDVYR